MAKDNLFLGFGRGKVGDVVFYRLGGQQVARARNRSPRNPQTVIQLLQRVLLKTSSVAYSLLQDICNHSFQGLMEGTESQSRFTKLNVAMFRRQLRVLIETGDPEEILGSTDSNFAERGSTLAEFNPYVVSEGTIQANEVQFISSNVCLMCPLPTTATKATITYQQVVDVLGLNRGDQLTFLCLAVDDREGEGILAGVYSAFRYARVILEPDDGDMTSTFFNGTAINKPNPRNSGNLTLDFVPAAESVPAHFTFVTEGIDTAISKANSLAAGTVITSRLTGSVWQRSPQSLVCRSYRVDVPGHLEWDHGTDYLGWAIQTFMTNQQSSLYLNQSENF